MGVKPESHQNATPIHGLNQLASVWPTGRHYGWAAIAFVLFAAYGSLVPFHYTPRGIGEASRQFLRLFRQLPESFSRTDLVVNVALFVPVGFCLFGWLRADRRGRGSGLAAALFVWALCAVASLAIEFAQLWFQLRTASALDILAQSLGAIVGIVLWGFIGIAVTDWLRSCQLSARRQEPIDWALRIYFLGLVVYRGWPFDLTVRPAELVRKYRAGKIVLRPFTESDGVRLWVDAASHLAASIPIGMLAMTLLLPTGRQQRSRIGGALIGVVLLLGVFFLGLLVPGRVTTTSDLITGTIGVVLGACLMHWWRRDWVASEKTVAGGESRSRTALYGSMAIIYALVLVILFCAPFDMVTEPEFVKSRLSGFFRAPLTSLYHGSVVNAVKEVARKVLLFAPLGVLLALATFSAASSASGRRLLLYLGAFLAGVVALCIELAQVVLPGHTADLTDVLLCTFGAVLGIYLTQRRMSGDTRADSRRNAS